MTYNYFKIVEGEKILHYVFFDDSHRNKVKRALQQARKVAKAYPHAELQLYQLPPDDITDLERMRVATSCGDNRHVFDYAHESAKVCVRCNDPRYLGGTTAKPVSHRRPTPQPMQSSLFNEAS